MHFGAIFLCVKKCRFASDFAFVHVDYHFRQYFFSLHPLCRISDRIHGSTHQGGSNSASFIWIRSVVQTWIANKAVFATHFYILPTIADTADFAPHSNFYFFLLCCVLAEIFRAKEKSAACAAAAAAELRFLYILNIIFVNFFRFTLSMAIFQSKRSIYMSRRF